MMELKRFIAENSREALQQVKENHGDDALIISTTKVGKKTEVICAVDESLDGEKAPGTKTNATTPPNASSETSVAKNTEALRDELSSIEFSEQLGRIVSRSESKKPSKTPDINELMKTIQADLSDLRNKMENQANTVTPINKARSALNSFGKREKFLEKQDQLADSISKLLEKQICSQRHWKGINVFYGMPGSGKTRTIESIISGIRDQEDLSDCNLIEFNSSEGSDLQNFGNLSKLSEHFNVAHFRESNPINLMNRLKKLDESSRTFVEVSYRDLELIRHHYLKLNELGVNHFLCLAADAALHSMRKIVDTSPDLLQSIVMTRLDLIPEIDDLLAALADLSGSILAVYSHTSNDDLASVDLPSGTIANV